MLDESLLCRTVRLMEEAEGHVAKWCIKVSDERRGSGILRHGTRYSSGEQDKVSADDCGRCRSASFDA